MHDELTQSKTAPETATPTMTPRLPSPTYIPSTIATPRPLIAPHDRGQLTSASAAEAAGVPASNAIHPGENMPTKQPKTRRNWLMRHLFPHNHTISLFQPRPYSTPLCFSVSKSTVRAAIVSLLRSWKRYGVCDVTCDRTDPTKDVVRMRVDRINSLGIKAVEVEIEVFGVIERETKVNGSGTGEVRKGLAVARVRQVGGAGSSFWRVVDEMEKGLGMTDRGSRRGSRDGEGTAGADRPKGVLIERGERWDEMSRVLYGVE